MKSVYEIMINLCECVCAAVYLSCCLVCMHVCWIICSNKNWGEIKRKPTSSSSSRSTQMNCVSNFNFVAKWLNEWSHWITNWPDRQKHPSSHNSLAVVWGFFLHCVCFSFTIFGAAAAAVVKILLLFTTLNRCFSENDIYFSEFTPVCSAIRLLALEISNQCQWKMHYKCELPATAIKSSWIKRKTTYNNNC